MTAAIARAGVDALLFDLGNVLLAFDFGRACAHWARAAGVPLERVSARFALGAEYHAYERGEIDDATFFAHLRGQLDLPLDDATLLHGWNAIFIGPVPGMPEVVASLAQQVPLHVFSNTSDAHQRFFSEAYADVLRPFRTVSCSHRVGHRKPTREAFEAVLERIGLPAERVAFFDDLDDNVDGARAVGLHAFRARSVHDVQAALANRIDLSSRR